MIPIRALVYNCETIYIYKAPDFQRDSCGFEVHGSCNMSNEGATCPMKVQNKNNKAVKCKQVCSFPPTVLPDDFSYK